MNDNVTPYSHYYETARQLAARFSIDAAERDKAGGIPYAQLAQLRESGLLHLVVPKAYGGTGVPWSVLLRLVRIISQADSALGHLLGYHYLAIVSVSYRSDAQHAEYYYSLSNNPNIFWGNAVNAASRSLKGKRQADGSYLLNGVRPYCSGAPGSDQLMISWEDDENEVLFFGSIPTLRPGVKVNDDWDSFGQRQTGSGTTEFTDVRVEESEIFDGEANIERAYGTIGPLLSQSVLLNVFIGSAQGALAEAKEYVRDHARAWGTSGVEKATDDPGIQRQFGELYTQVAAATALADNGLIALDNAWEQGVELEAETRGEAAVVIATANIFAGEVALEVSSKIFAIMGTRSTLRERGLDRFWRNVRVHTLHNPAEYKLRSVGRWYATGAYPTPGHYS